ncbi:hypothetical protein A0J61_05191 [Choanephora cucurbitarum]|uniref:Flavin reductase like domain-containing protein n=1 Tax=Choanephora cucurbitarum TaxID=101091 RepID=A0A1C7NCM8_9FUNG|nr:hypothetical protein A0J61_05191 [Choanephora cucurbitarum]
MDVRLECFVSRKSRPWINSVRLFSAHSGLTENVRGIMRKVPLPVVVVTTSRPEDRNHRRGITVASFTSVCLHPQPLVSFCVRTPSRASDLLHSSGSMVLNLLSHEQVQQSVAFSSPDKDQFKDVPFYDDPVTGLPVLIGTLGAMHCKKFKVMELGDHELWIAQVLKVEEGVGGEHGVREEAQPLLYYERNYCSVGDQVFMKSFMDNQDQSAHNWMHRAHLRMAWNMIRELGPVAAEPAIKEALRTHFSHAKSNNKDYHETITSFYIALVSAAINSYKGRDSHDFFALVEKFPQLLDVKLIEQYYSPHILYAKDAKETFVKPDLQPLPTQLIEQ